jgi:hypothetical protein
MSWTDYVPSVPFQLGKSIYEDSQNQNAQNNQRDQARGQLAGIGQNAQTFSSALQSNYGVGTRNIGQDRGFLQALASGQHSIAGEQLRQGMQQGLAAQQSMAAGANPANQAMAARNAAMNMNRLSYGLSGQQALAGLQERQQAQQQLAQLDLNARGQDMQGALGSQQNATEAYKGILGAAPNRTFWDQYGQAITGGLGSAAAMSDERLKKDVKDADDHANKAMDGMKAYLYRYKDEKYGKGQQFGIMAQALEKSGLGHAVIETPVGKAVDGAKLSTANTAMLAALAKRVNKLEGKGE